MSRGHLRTILTSAALGAAAAILLDPQSGGRRRALVRDKLRHYVAVFPRRLGGDLDLAGGHMKGAIYHVFHPLAGCQAELVDDVDLKHRVESELGRDEHLPLSALNFDAIDGIVRVRGTVAEASTARQIVEETAGVDGARAVISLMRLPDGTPAGGMAGDIELIDAGPRAAVHGEAVRQAILDRWPSMNDAAILASDGHLGKLSAQISERTGEPKDAVRVDLEEILIV